MILVHRTYSRSDSLLLLMCLLTSTDFHCLLPNIRFTCRPVRPYPPSRASLAQPAETLRLATALLQALILLLAEFVTVTDSLVQHQQRQVKLLFATADSVVSLVTKATATLALGTTAVSRILETHG